jgi:hypothetical protein
MLVKASYFVPEEIIPAHEEDIIEWDCPESLLKEEEHHE